MRHEARNYTTSQERKSPDFFSRPLPHNWDDTFLSKGWTNSHVRKGRAGSLMTLFLFSYCSSLGLGLFRATRMMNDEGGDDKIDEEEKLRSFL